MAEPASSREPIRRGIVAVGVRGYKSLHEPQDIEIRPLTVIAGVNSSGKSSLLQPLLLMKQTLEAPFDPGPLLLDGPHVSITSLEQILSRGTSRTPAASSFEVRLAPGDGRPLTVEYGRSESGDLKLLSMTGPMFEATGVPVTLVEGETIDMSRMPDYEDYEPGLLSLLKTLERSRDFAIVTVRDRCFLDLQIVSRDRNQLAVSLRGISVAGAIGEDLTRIVHIPALRGNPARAYPVVAALGTFEGPFYRYTAGVVAAWQEQDDTEKLEALRADLVALALTSAVQARKLDDTRVELLVGRLPAASISGLRDMVNIADVGFGVSQTLPVVVALLVAEPGQLVYLEQPEIHLHPRAQVAFAALLHRAAARGVRVVVETHSSLLIRGIQTSVAEGDLDPSDVVLHWCTRNPDTGYTNVTTGVLDSAGAFGDWPEDFDEVNLDAEERYLNAAGRKDFA